MSEHGSTSRRRRSTSEPRGAVPEAVQDPRELARSIVLRQLTAGPRTRRELADALARRHVPEHVIEQTLDRFEELQLVDDAAFAQAWVETRHQGRGLARRALAHELRHRGVAEETVREAVEGIDPDAELAAARRLVRARLAATRGDDPARRLRRLSGMLARKGYGPGISARAVREELREESSTGEEPEGLDDLLGEG